MITLRSIPASVLEGKVLEGKVLEGKVLGGKKSRDSKVVPIKGGGGVIEGISVECHIYDKIHEAGSFPDRASSHEVPIQETVSWPIKWLLEFLRLTYYNKNFYGNFKNQLQAATRASIGGVGFDQEAKLARVENDRFVDAIAFLQSGVLYVREKRIKREVQKFLTKSSGKHFSKNKDTLRTELGSEIIGKSLGRLPFVTRKGHLVLSSEHVERGDVVAVIKGGGGASSFYYAQDTG
ncbi:hypothetical protein GQ43DRAFT_212275 [Delitschia confertaspora ATCC 74209]|uniref:Uncharacterized protein n=1 Tax=Delitschia confertaspora ATCC 74209 TaxID=1513339 RepID=A0A9P4JDX5_9PLEO|nr:hypothetical protein GQ43DRAFT_212275 [Delitschia confertaspora ATCC 74209]